MRMSVAAVGAWIALVAGTGWGAEDEATIQNKPVSHWLKQMRSENRGLQLRAAKVLAEVPEELRTGIVSELTSILGSERENDRFVAAQVLGEYGSKAKAAVPHLLPVLEGTQFERNRAAAAKALGQIFKDSPPSEELEKVTAALIKGFTDKYVDVRRESVRACGMIGPAAKACLTHMEIPFSEPDTENGDGFAVREEAAWTCGRMGPLAAMHMDRLIAQLHREGKHSRGKQSPVIVEAIGRIGPVYEQLVPNIVDAMEARGKFRMGEDPISPFFPKALDTLALFGPKAVAAVPYLAKLAREGAKPWVPQDVAALIKVVKTLGAIGPEAKEAVPDLEKLRGFKTNKGDDDKALEKELQTEVEKALTKLKGGGDERRP